MKTILVFMIMILGSLNLVAQSFCQHFKKCNYQQKISRSGQFDNFRSDTADVLNYNIILDLTSGNIIGESTISFVSKQSSISSISLDLLKLVVDSVKNNGVLTTYSYNDTLLVLQLQSPLNLYDTGQVEVFYHGIPQQDASGWGGWYSQSDYAYNLGVGFAADPHNYGRVWHPCFDNFVERATYEFEIITDGNKKAYCNGLLVDTVSINGKLHSFWSMKSSIPTYLATVAVAPYTHVEQKYVSSVSTDTIPVYLIAKPSDTTNFKSSFTNLFGAIQAFENNYDSYQWDKVGFYLVPFNGGAMEHATSIAYPLATINGLTTNETLMAHELSHHWWGNLVTCRTDEDMWINEGMASYSEHIFLEQVYGYQSYINEVKLNHIDVLHFAHVNDNGYLSLHGVPHAYTYGDHSYNKGADVAHTLRAYMGDSMFFAGLRSFLNTYSFKDVDAYDFMDHLNTLPGVDVTQFFNDWIFGAGFPDFSIDSIISNSTGSGYLVEVFVKQKLRGTNDLFDLVPLDVTFVNSDWTEHIDSFIMSGTNASFSFNLPFEPQWAYLNGDDKISQAVTGENVIINSTGTKDLSYSMSRVTTSSIIDSSFVRIEHHWASPDGFKDGSKYFMYELSEERYWRVAGDFSSDFSSVFRLFFNGTTSGAGYLDNELTSLPGFHEDSIQLFYREDASVDWEPLNISVIQNLGSHTDGYGFVEIDTLMAGEYTWGWKKSNVGLYKIDDQIWSVYPNPSNGNIKIIIPEQGKLSIYDLHGRKIKEFLLSKGENTIRMVKGQKGSYLLVYDNNRQLDCKKIIIE